jgi:hypothetical protein
MTASQMDGVFGSDIHDIQGGNGADASFRFLPINRQNVMSVGTNIEVNIRATY